VRDGRTQCREHSSYPYQVSLTLRKRQVVAATLLVPPNGAVAFNPTEWYAFGDHSPIVATFED
jgi:hypothetical protein